VLCKFRKLALGVFTVMKNQHVCPFRACSERCRRSWWAGCWREGQQLISRPFSCGCRAWYQHQVRHEPVAGAAAAGPPVWRPTCMWYVSERQTALRQACQATCLVQSSDVWSNLASTWSIWPVQRVCVPGTRQFACFVACCWSMCAVSCAYSLWFILCLDCIMGGLSFAFWCIKHNCGRHTCITSTQHGVILAQKPIGQHHVAPVRDFYEHHTLSRDESCMLNLQPTI